LVNGACEHHSNIKLKFQAGLVSCERTVRKNTELVAWYGEGARPGLYCQCLTPIQLRDPNPTHPWAHARIPHQYWTGSHHPVGEAQLKQAIQQEISDIETDTRTTDESSFAHGTLFKPRAPYKKRRQREDIRTDEDKSSEDDVSATIAAKAVPGAQRLTYKATVCI
jgi:hypothetical protein